MFSDYWWEQYRAEIIPATIMFLVALILTAALRPLMPDVTVGVRTALGFFAALFVRKPIHSYMERFGFKFDADYNRNYKSVWRLAWATAVLIAFAIYLFFVAIIFQLSTSF